MVPSFIFTRFAQKKFLKLEKATQERVSAKIQELKQHEEIAAALKPLTNFAPATHRLRVGAYRLILQRISETDFLVIDIGHRSQVYK
jgi:mRNA-degrading endonuclease RelE of RelBE toxin-antitoxin system